MAPGQQLRAQLAGLEASFRSQAPELAVFLVFDRPGRVNDRPGLERAMFRERCLTEERLDAIVSALRDVGAWVRVFLGEDEFLAACAAGDLTVPGRSRSIVYNGIEGGIAHDGFAPGRKALIPAVADSYGLLCANSNPYACAIGRHKYHYFTLLQAHGVPVPDVWHYRLDGSWAGDRRPARGTRVITKSTYESWSVGVSDSSVFVVGEDLDRRVSAIADAIGQAVCVQAFVPGREVGVSVLEPGVPRAAPPIEVVLHKAPNDLDAIMTMEDNLASAAVSYQPLEAAPELIEELERVAIECFRVLELGAFARIDFRVAEDGTPWVSDVGVSPGLGPPGSSSFEALRVLGFDHDEFVRVVLGASLVSSGVFG